LETKKKVMVIFGTRPEATKMCPVVQQLKQHSDWFDTKVVVTGQHREQLYQALSHFSLTPDVDLSLMKENQSLAYFTSAAIAGLDNIISEDRPDMILVHGDTQTAMCGGLAAFFHKIPVGHVEAGLRSHNKYSPWPEEVNRRIVDVVTDLLFAPTSVGKDNLLREGYDAGHIYITGQTAVDAALQTYQEDYTFHEASLNELIHHRGRLITVTAHRRENYGVPMQNMFQAIRRIVDEHPDTAVIYPVHMSPVVRDAANTLLSGHERIHLLNTLEYPDMINLLARSYLIMSDSGGLQEETTVFNKPLVLMRDTTERPEAVEANMVALAGTEEDMIFNIANRLLADEQAYQDMTKSSNPFGDGQASKRIVDIIAHHFGFTPELPVPFVG